MSIDKTLFVVLLNKPAGHVTPRELVREHIAHLRRLDEAGKLVLCGPFTDHDSGMVVLRARDKAEASELAAADPFVTSGSRTFEVRTWLLANAANNYLG